MTGTQSARPRLFVCQGCGASHAILYGSRIICGCGSRSAAEVVAKKEPSEPNPSDRRHEILFRDWREQVAASKIDEAIQRVFDGRNAPRLYDVDTGQDAYAIVVSSVPMTPEQVQAVWETSCGR